MIQIPARLPIKLVQFLKLANIAESGSHANDLIASGDVTVNGDVRTERAAQLHDGDVVSVMGEDFQVVEG